MSALYLHIPFCKQACHYCDFHFSTNFRNKKEVVDAICKEIELQQNYLSNKKLNSIYFGGGTPSLLNESELTQIFETISKYFSSDAQTEITLEANPDDLNIEKLQLVKRLGINRLSIGIQSFNDEHLRYMNRSHTAQEAQNCIKDARQMGFESLTIDLIYGIPSPNHASWKKDLEICVALELPHISSYCLTIEDKTAFGHWLKKGKIKAIDDDFAVEQFELLVNTLQKNKYQHYEISNFALKDSYSQHNSNYWKKGAYLGVGPSAHSYNGESRQYNIANNRQYVLKISEGKIPCQIEVLTHKDHINEYIMTSLRTQWGCDLDFLAKEFQHQFDKEVMQEIQNLQKEGLIFIDGKIIKLTLRGKLFADYLAAKLFS
jgi:oxygen-independent coproporphyrinogen-3 oxidase